MKITQPMFTKFDGKVACWSWKIIRFSRSSIVTLVLALCPVHHTGDKVDFDGRQSRTCRIRLCRQRLCILTGDRVESCRGNDCQKFITFSSIHSAEISINFLTIESNVRHYRAACNYQSRTQHARLRRRRLLTAAVTIIVDAAATTVSLSSAIFVTRL